MTISCQNVEVANLAINSTPSGATIYVNNVSTGRTTNTAWYLAPGTYAIKLTLAGYQDYIVDAGSFTTTTSLQTINATLSPDTGGVTISSTPAGADIYIDDTLQTGTTPQTYTDLTPVLHTYKLVKQGYNDTVGSFTILPGQTITEGPILLSTYIVATDIVVTRRTIPCIAGTCIVDVTATWRNDGATDGTFMPNITIDGTPAAPTYPYTSLAPGLTLTRNFEVSGLSPATHTICPSPNI